MSSKLYSMDQYLGVFNVKGLWGYTRGVIEVDTQRLYCNEYHDIHSMTGQAGDCEQECYTMQSFSVIAIVFVFFATVIMSFPAHNEWRMAAGCCAFVGFVSYGIVWAVATSQYDRTSSTSSACSYGNNKSNIKPSSSYILFVVASILSLFQVIIAFTTRDVQLISDN